MNVWRSSNPLLVKLEFCSCWGYVIGFTSQVYIFSTVQRGFKFNDPVLSYGLSPNTAYSDTSILFQLKNKV